MTIWAMAATTAAKPVVKVNGTILTEADLQVALNEITPAGVFHGGFSKDPAIQKLITRDLNNGRQSGVRGTPAIFLNGKRLNNLSLAGFQQAINAELRKM